MALLLASLAFDISSRGLYFTCGFVIGKLIIAKKVTGKVINGAIVLRETYEKHSVAVKRLLQSHHNVSDPEKNILIKSVEHSNIVRYFEDEEDQDFHYIYMERCKCNLHQLILACKSPDQETARDLDHEAPTFIDSNIELWKTNGYPSKLLVKLMR